MNICHGIFLLLAVTLILLATAATDQTNGPLLELLGQSAPTEPVLKGNRVGSPLKAWVTLIIIIRADLRDIREALKGLN